MRLLLLFLVTKLAAGQLALTNDVELVPAMANMPQITSLDVQCEKSGMTVNVAFSQPFDGVIFSKGHFSNPACRYVRANSGRTSYSFVIPMVGCGTRTFDNDDDGSTGFENMIMIQNEEIVQEVWDTARKITCDWTTRMEKLITFRPFAVDMLQAKEVRYSGDDVMCWMDIQLGKGPFSNTVDGIVKIGDELTVVIYSKDGGSEFDMLVKNCFAYDSDDLEDERTTRLQLSDERGCLLKPKLMSFFSRTRQTGTTGADIIAFASLFAFKFPDKMDVYLSCEVELCKGGCTNLCEDSTTDRIVSSSTTTTTHAPPDICVTQPGLPSCCARNPNHPACTTTTTARPDPCAINPRSPQCCARNPNQPQCTTTTTRRTTTQRTTTTPRDPCDINPRSRACCARNPTSPQCITTTTRPSTTTRIDPCLFNPGSPSCCARDPNHPECRRIITTTARPDPCAVNPRSTQCCSIRPNSPLCTTTTTHRPTTTSPTTRRIVTTTTPRPDPCALNPRSSQCCALRPNSIFCTTTTQRPTTSTTPRPDPCDVNPRSSQCCALRPNSRFCTTTTQRPTTSTTPRPDPCDVNPRSFQCCARRPNSPSCRTPTTTTPRPDPCDINPRSPQCCARRPNSVFCTTTTTPPPDPCDLNPSLPQCCARNPNLPQCTTTTTTPTTRRPTTPFDPCAFNPSSPQCCARNPNAPQCTTTTTTRRPVTTTTTQDPCISNPGSRQCCARNPNHPRCVTTAPCSGPRDPRLECRPTTQVPSTTPNLENHAFHAWQNRASSTRRRRPPYGTRLTPGVLAELSNQPRRRRDVALPPPPPPPRNTIAMVRGFRVVGANDLTFKAVSSPNQSASSVDSICMPTATFTISLLMLSLLLITAVLVATFTCLRLRTMAPLKAVEAKNPYYKQ